MAEADVWFNVTQVESQVGSAVCRDADEAGIFPLARSRIH